MKSFPPNRSRVVVGLSGGVDSSVSAWLLQQQGYDVHGLFMFNWDEDEQAYCTAAEDFQDAQKVCSHLGIPLHRVDFADEYRQLVFDRFLDGLRRGLTPNPDVLCNREIKFGHFHKYALRLGADFIATGHYARVVEADGHHQLHRGADDGKDQSYFLHAVSETALAQTLFPLGRLSKTRVRELALQQGLHNFRKRDSTGICFIGERPFREFLERYLPNEPGPMRTPDGHEVGQHVGLAFYTLGQRQGLGIGGVRGASPDAWYVVGKYAGDNALIVAQGHDHPWLRSHWLSAGEMHWINAPPSGELQCQVATRYRQRAGAALLLPDPDHPARVRVDFEVPQWAVTPGQYAVVYAGERCLGGGVIMDTGRACQAETEAV